MAGWEQHVRKVIPYVPGEQPRQEGMIKLNTNENPYPPAPGVARALREMDPEQFRLYPDPAASLLVDSLARRYGLASNQIFVGVGSDDVLAMAFLTFFNGKKPILFPDITYSFYDVWANLYRIPYQCQPLDEAFCIRPEDYERENGGIVLANPNAPTGVAAGLKTLQGILEQNRDVIVIIDEAYIDFGGDSAVSLIPSYDNLLVVQTFSKSRSMAGMRIGYAMGQPRLIQYLNDVKYSFNSYTMSQASLRLGAEAVAEEAYFLDTTKKIINTRERVKKELTGLGFVFPDSKGNFIFASHPQISAQELFEALKREKIYVRYFPKPRIQDYLRITVGTDSQMDILLSFLKDYTSIDRP
ncbi:MAG: histidinol-phosphate transaminase [Lachnospiraceae bacterium]|nr:histidinol-phosphate transaminase [Lachnospiraceae bacterium]